MSEETREITISVSYENPDRRAFRLGLLFIGSLILAVAAGLLLEGEILTFVYCLDLVLLLSLSRRLGRRRALVLRNIDLYTVGGAIDRPIAWGAIESATYLGYGFSLSFHGGATRVVPLRFLSAVEAQEAVERIFRCLDLYRHDGPLRLPSLSNFEISSGTVTLRLLERGDREFRISVVTSETYDEFQLWNQPSRELAGAIFDESIRSYREAVVSWCLVVEVDKVPIGLLYLDMIDLSLRQAQIGIEILHEYQNRGYGSEAIRLLVEFFSRESNLTKLSAGSFSDNVRCRRALEKAGFRFVGNLDRFWIKKGCWKAGDFFEIDLLEHRKIPSPTTES